MCSSVRVSNTGSAWHYVLMKFALQESECLRNLNREATSPGRARFDVVTAMLAEDSGLHVASDAVAVCERLLAFQSYCRPSKLRELLVCCTEPHPRRLQPRSFYCCRFGQIKCRTTNTNTDIQRLTVDVVHFEICFTFLCHLLTACTYVHRISCDAR